MFLKVDQEPQQPKRPCTRHQAAELLHTKSCPSANVIPDYCLSLHGMVWIVTLRSQCNYCANTKACACSPAASGGCVFVCLNKHAPSFFLFVMSAVCRFEKQTPKGVRPELYFVGWRTKSSSSAQIIQKMKKRPMSRFEEGISDLQR